MEASFKFKIKHSTTYEFDAQVFLEPHFLRFRPQNTSYIDIEQVSVSILNQSSNQRALTDEENNAIDFCWFDGTTNQLIIEAESIITIKPYDSFNFLIHPSDFNQLGFKYDDMQQHLLAPALEKSPLSHSLIEYGNKSQSDSNFNTIQFLMNLTRKIHQDFIVEYREEGFPMFPDVTFEFKRGSCRDLSWMQIKLLRHYGIATRFVSGYFYFEIESPNYELHAWIEVFLPGAGWVGFDPTHGIMTGNTHIPLASSAYFEKTMPVSGSIRGSATSKLTTQLDIEVI